MSGEREIIRFLDDLRRGQRNEEAAFRILASEIDRFRSPTDEHEVWWNTQAWSDAPTLRDNSRVKELAEALRAQHPSGSQWVLISRGDVFARRDLGPEDLFLAAMAWGFGPTNYGWKRTSTMLRNAEDVGGIEAVVESLRAAWHESGAAGVAKAWSRVGSAKVRSLDTAFASKLAYFACYDRKARIGPLIADANTAWAVSKLAGIKDSLKKPVAYESYVAWVGRQASKLGRRSDDVERALFVLGPDVKRIWKRLES